MYVGCERRGVEGALKRAPDRRRKGWSEGVRRGPLICPHCYAQNGVSPSNSCGSARTYIYIYTLLYILFLIYKCIYLHVCACHLRRVPRIIILYTRVLYTRDRIMLCRKPDAGKYFNIRFRARCLILYSVCVATTDNVALADARAVYSRLYIGDLCVFKVTK